VGKEGLNIVKRALLAGRLNRATNVYIIIIIAGLVFMLLPSFVPAYLRDILTKVFILAIFGMSLNLLVGYTGLFSLGHAAYFGAAAYTSSVLMVHCGVESFWLVAPAGILMAVLLASFFGFVAVRLHGTYFVFVTAAFGQLLYGVAVKWQTVTGGTNGLVNTAYPDLGLPWFTMNAMSFYYLVFVVFVISLLLLYRLVKSPFGVALQGIRDSETRMRSLGYNTWLYKYIAFVVAGLLAGVAGVLFGYHSTLLAPVHLDITTSTLVALVVIIGSDRVVWGPLVGAFVIAFVEYYSSIYISERWPIIMGGFLVISVMFLRGGISIHLLKLWKKVEYRYGSIKG